MLTAKLFTNGSSQAVRLPKEFRFNGTEVYVQKVGSSVMLVVGLVNNLFIVIYSFYRLSQGYVIFCSYLPCLYR